MIDLKDPFLGTLLELARDPDYESFMDVIYIETKWNPLLTFHQLIETDGSNSLDINRDTKCRFVNILKELFRKLMNGQTFLDTIVRLCDVSRYGNPYRKNPPRNDISCAVYYIPKPTPWFRDYRFEGLPERYNLVREDLRVVDALFCLGIPFFVHEGLQFVSRIGGFGTTTLNPSWFPKGPVVLPPLNLNITNGDRSYYGSPVIRNESKQVKEDFEDLRFDTLTSV